MNRAKFKKVGIRVIYTVNDEGGFVVPMNECLYFLAVDRDRRFERVKKFLLKRLLTLAEMLAN